MSDNEHPVRLVCGNCATTETYASWGAAESDGWDTLSVFGYNACPACPGVSVYIPMYLCQQARMALTAGEAEKAERLFNQAADETMAKHPRFSR